MKTLQQHKADSTLNKVFRYPEGVMTRREWLNLMIIRGCNVEGYQKHMLDYNRTKYNRLTGKEQDEYERKCNTMVTGYRLNIPGGCFQDITKTEYDYFNNMVLAEDIATQKNELSYKIEAGIATEQEENEAMQPEFNFFSKYCK